MHMLKLMSKLIIKISFNRFLVIFYSFSFFRRTDTRAELFLSYLEKVNLVIELLDEYLSRAKR